MRRRRRACQLLGLLLACTAAEAGLCAGFAVRVSPPRFELAGQPGEVLRGVLEIGNDDPVDVSRLSVRTADWDLDDDGAVQVHPPQLAPGSCRPWTRIERRELELAPRGRRRFRFEVELPADAPPGECRFALLIAPLGDPETGARAGNLNVPVSGQVAVIVYVAVGGARPNLEFRELKMAPLRGRALPVLVLHNSGNAHGRPEGLIEAKDGRGQALDFVVTPFPVLPGRSSAVALVPRSPEDPSREVEFVLPVHLQGRVEWEGGGLELDSTLR